MRSALRSALAADAQRRSGRARSNSLSTVTPAQDSPDYLPELAAIAATILYRSPLPSKAGRPVYVLNAAAFPDAFDVDYDTLLAYVLARLPGEEELIAGTEYEIVFFAGGPPDNATAEKKQGPATGWYLQAYHVLGRALRKKLAMLYIVHPRTWVRVLLNIFGTVVSPKFRRKILHVNCLTSLALHVPIEQLLIPPSAYLQDRKYSPDIFSPLVTGRRAFHVRHPLPRNVNTGKTRLPRVMREATSFLIEPANLRVEGIFRIPPHSMLVSVLKEAYDRGQQWIVWKEKTVTHVQPGLDRSLVDEIRLEDAYGVHSAASLIKTWYRELREPIFPESCYPTLRERYRDVDVELTPEDMVDIIMPSSSASPLTESARDILTRHLLPLLSLVASYEPDNKMSAENLAICFSMCLVRGSDEIADAKISSIVKRILISAIEIWPQLRAGLDLQESTFYAELKAPADPNEYEDPLEALQTPSSASDGSSDKSQIGHRISMNESDSSDSAPEKPPALPPRRSRAASIKAALTPHMPNVDMPKFPKRNKSPPAHPISGSTAGTEIAASPPRYSSLFDSEGRFWQRAELPANDTAAQHRNPSPLRGNDHHLEDPRAQKSIHRRPVGEAGRSRPVSAEITGYSVSGFSGDILKRKPVSRHASVKGENKPAETSAQPNAQRANINTALQSLTPSESTNISPQSPHPTSPSATLSTNTSLPITTQSERLSTRSPNSPSMPPGVHAVMAEMAARQSANTSSQNPGDGGPINSDSVSPTTTSATPAKPSPSATNPSQPTTIFRKPSWPASAANKPRSEIQCLAKPILPPRKLSSGMPVLPVPSSAIADGVSGNVPPHVPKPRAPSAGLLNRMNSWESRGSAESQAPTGGSARLMPSKLDLKKSSVDDLRRLYEERATTAETLVNLGRRASSKH